MFNQIERQAVHEQMRTWGFTSVQMSLFPAFLICIKKGEGNGMVFSALPTTNRKAKNTLLAFVNALPDNDEEFICATDFDNE